MEKSKSLLTSECVAVEKEIKLNICYLLQCAADHWHCNVSMSILCRGEPVTWKFIISNEHCCTHFVWWWSIITTVQSTIRTIGYSKQRKYFLMQFKKNLRGQTMLQHHAVNNNTFSTFLGQKCFEFLFSGPAQQYLSSIMILDNGFGQNVTYLSKSPRNPTVSSKLVSVVGSHAMRDIECRKKTFCGLDLLKQAMDL